MAVTFSVPASPEKSKIVIDNFKGVDLTSSPDLVDFTRSPNGINFTRSVPGKVRKRMGYRKGYSNPSGSDIGAVAYVDNKYLMATDRAIYNFKDADERLYDIISTQFSSSGHDFIQMDSETVLFFGRRSFLASASKAESFYGTDKAYIPTVSISRSPKGGGTPYEDVNLLSKGFTDSFLGTATDKNYSLSFNGLDYAPDLTNRAIVKVLDTNGVWQTKREGTDYTVNMVTGVVTFSTAPGVSPITGEDNVKITAFKEFEEYGYIVNNFRFAIRYGEGGSATNMVFACGYPYYNRDYFTTANNPYYIPDLNYSEVGIANNPILGYAIVDGKLITFKDERKEVGNNIFVRSWSTLNDRTILRTENTLVGEAPISHRTIAYVNDEVIYASRSGINAIARLPYANERCVERRGYFLEGIFKKLNLDIVSEEMDSVGAIVYNGMYLLYGLFQWTYVEKIGYVGTQLNKILVLDPTQITYPSENSPYSTKQYSAFVWDNIYTEYMWLQKANAGAEERLFFSGASGYAKSFFTEPQDLYSYVDDAEFDYNGKRIDGHPIVAEWETPDIVGSLFYKNKTLRYIALKVQSALATSVKIYVMERGLWNYQNEDISEQWELLKEDNLFARYLQFSKIIFSKFSFSTDKTQRISRTKTRIKKVDKFRLKFVNDKLDEPFEIADIAMEFIENGNFKG